MNVNFVLRLAKIVAVSTMAFYASLVAIGNITDYGSNFEFVKHVLLMDTIFKDSQVTWRATKSPLFAEFTYISIIALESMTALFFWVGACIMLTKIRSTSTLFNAAKPLAIIGLTLGFLTWQVIFMSIGGEWFAMWQSKKWNGIDAAYRVLMIFLLFLIFVSLDNDCKKDTIE